jgi:trehalose utilization protein
MVWAYWRGHLSKVILMTPPCAEGLKGSDHWLIYWVVTVKNPIGTGQGEQIIAHFGYS